jgi:PAS domain S-box-containing protein
VTVAAPRPSAPAPATLDFALLRGALEEIPFGVATTRAGVILYANEALARIYGVPQGSLENRQIAQLFPDDVFAGILERLTEARVFDGRVSARAFDGRPIDAEVHVESYSSEAQGVGGFLVVRDVSLELGALGRLVDQLGGALFRVRVADTAVEMVSPAISKLTGIDAPTAMLHPVLLTALVSAEERERVMFLYRRLAKGEMPVASAQVSLHRSDGSVRVLHVRATSRRDSTGTVRHIDGVVSEASHEGAYAQTSGRDGDSGGEGGVHETRPRGRPADPLSGWLGSAPRVEMGYSPDAQSSATMAISHELLREGSQLLHTLGRELRGVRNALKAVASSLSPVAMGDLGARLDASTSIVAGAAALNRGVRRVLTAATTLGAPFSEVLENMRATLVPVLGAGERAITIDAGDAANVVVPERVEELGAALVYLSLRAFRFAGSGTLHVLARRAEAPPEPHRRGRLSRAVSERSYLVIEIVGAAPADLADTAVEISSDMLRAIPRPAEADVAYQAAVALLGSVGGIVESDDATFSTARTVIRLRG